jgi:hypothetical protein
MEYLKEISLRKEVSERDARDIAIFHTPYSLRFGKKGRLGQRHGFQNITLTYIFYNNIY